MTRTEAITKLEALMIQHKDSPAAVANCAKSRDKYLAMTDAEYDAMIAAARAAGLIK